MAHSSAEVFFSSNAREIATASPPLVVLQMRPSRSRRRTRSVGAPPSSPALPTTNCSLVSASCPVARKLTMAAMACAGSDARSERRNVSSSPGESVPERSLSRMRASCAAGERSSGEDFGAAFPAATFGTPTLLADEGCRSEFPRSCFPQTSQTPSATKRNTSAATTIGRRFFTVK